MERRHKLNSKPGVFKIDEVKSYWSQEHQHTRQQKWIMQVVLVRSNNTETIKAAKLFTHFLQHRI